MWGCHGSERAFVVFLLPIWAGKVRAETKKIWDYREGEEENGKDIFYINRDKAEGKVVLVTERGVLCKVCKKSLAKQNGQPAD